MRTIFTNIDEDADDDFSFEEEIVPPPEEFERSVDDCGDGR